MCAPTPSSRYNYNESSMYLGNRPHPIFLMNHIKPRNHIANAAKTPSCFPCGIRNTQNYKQTVLIRYLENTQRRHLHTGLLYNIYRSMWTLAHGKKAAFVVFLVY